MKVYLVEGQIYSDADVEILSYKVGVYSSEKSAIFAGDNFIGDGDPKYNCYTIEEMEVND